MIKSRLLTLIILILILMPACRRGATAPPPGILSRDQMIAVLADIHLVDAMIHEETNSPRNKNDLGLTWYPSVLEKHGVTRAGVDSSLFYYNSRPKDFDALYREVLKKLNQQLDEMKKEEQQIINEE